MVEEITDASERVRLISEMPASSGSKKSAGQSTLLSFFGKSKQNPSPAAGSVKNAGKNADPSSGTVPASSLPASAAGSGSLNTPVSQSRSIRAVEPSSSPLTRRKRVISDSDSEDDFDSIAAHPLPSSPPERKLASQQPASESLESEPSRLSGQLERLSPSEPSIKSEPAMEVDPEPVLLQKFAKGSDYMAQPHKPSRESPSAASPAKKRRSDGTDEERYSWLLDIKDADGHRPDHPDYDPRTLFIPSHAWAHFTPFEKQYWEVKAKLWNTVVFFKKGKFYELYENDAEIAHSQFDLKLAGGGRANMSLCGVPEMSFDYWASAFIAKGYKVARVDQAETALGKEMRDQSAGKKEEKIIRRQLSSVLTAGTLTDGGMLVSDLSQYCMALKQGDDGIFGMAFVDTATGQFWVAEFEDSSADYAQLETLMAQTRPREIVVERGNLDRAAAKVVRASVSVDTLWEVLRPGDEFWDADRTAHHLATAQYFEAEDADDRSHWPKALVDTVENQHVALSALGGLIWYLRSLKLDTQLVSMGQFHDYRQSLQPGAGAMLLDGHTLQNLEVFANTWDGGSDGTLYKLINKCVTPFGKRRLRTWVAHPLQSPAEISARQDAVDLLLVHDELREALEAKLTGLPDAERMLSRVHAGSLRPRDFGRLVHGLERMGKLLSWLATQARDIGNPLLLQVAESLQDLPVKPWMSAFDHALAANQDLLVPEPGVEPEFDSTKAACTEIEAELQRLLSGYRQQFSSQTPVFRDSGKEIYLVELPTKLAARAPREWQQMGATSKTKRFWPPEVRTLVRQLQEAQETHRAVANSVQQRLYRRFVADYPAWLGATRAVANVDCLVSLARTSAQMPVHCRPEFVADGPTVVDFRDLRHPCSSAEFIPNDITLGGDSEARISLLTGANAAGKSTVLRMTGCAVLLAQLGCHVPATSARLTPVDRILTRLGASDNIFAGKSTFHVELSETQRILAEATPRSLVVLDELGRGGSSADGLAIAEAVLHHLGTHTGCVGFFATHYGTLVSSFSTHPGIKAERMAVAVDRGSREVTFLYRLEPGQSEGSFGMNVAAMCGVSPDIVDAAEQAAREFMGSSRQPQVAGGKRVALGLVSDMMDALRTVPSTMAIETMVAMSQAL